MNSAALSLIVSSASLVQTNYPNSICAIANCLLSQVSPNNETYHLPLQVRAWGADANNLAVLQENETILVLGSLWFSEEHKNWWIESRNIIIGYRGNAINNIDIVGRIGQDSKMHYFNNSNCVCRNSIAVRRGKNDSTWFEIQAWNKSGEALNEYGRKGEYIGASGSLEINQWRDEMTGEIRQKLRVNCKVQLLSSKPKELAVA